MVSMIGVRVNIIPGAANIRKGFYRNQGKGRWQGRTVKKPYWRVNFVHSDQGVFFPKQDLENHFLSFDRKYKAVNFSESYDLWAELDGYLYDTTGHWWIVHRGQVIAELGMPPREGRNLFMSDRSPNITYPDDSFWLVDCLGNRYEFDMAEDALLFATQNKNLFKDGHA